MRRFNYLIGRLHRTGFTWLAALVMIMALLPFLSTGLQPLGRSTESLRDPASPLYGVHFQRGVLPAELAIDHLRKDNIEELSAYLSYLRQEKSLISPNEPDGARRRFADFLARQEAIHLSQLRQSLGFIDQEAYYYGLYAPHWLQFFAGQDYDFFLQLGDTVLTEPAQWAEFAQDLLAADEPLLTAQAKNLLEGLPLTPEISASSRLLYLIQVSRFLLALLPLTVFYLVFAAADRNLREEQRRIDLTKGAAVFAASAATLILLRLFWYGVLYLRFGDAAGAMFIVPPWAALTEDPAGTVMRLGRFLQWVSAVDVAFLLFFSSFLLLLHGLLRRSDLTLLVGSASLLLPQPLLRILWAGALDPLPHFNFLHWSLRPDLFDYFPGPALIWGEAHGPYWLTPQRQIPSLLLWTLLLLGSSWLIGLLRQKIVIPRKRNNEHPS